MLVDSQDDLLFEDKEDYYEPCNKMFVGFQEELGALAFLSGVDVSINKLRLEHNKSLTMCSMKNLATYGPILLSFNNGN